MKQAKGIPQGTLYGYDLILMAPENERDKVINENTLTEYIKTIKNETN